MLAFLTLLISAGAMAGMFLSIRGYKAIRMLYLAQTKVVHASINDLLTTANAHAKRMETMGNAHHQLAGAVKQISDLIYEPENTRESA